MSEPLPVHQDGWGLILADPPWRYTAGQSIRIKPRYKTMTVQEICNLPVSAITAASGYILLWTTNAFLREALTVLRCWGAEYKSNIAWIKARPRFDAPEELVAAAYAAAQQHSEGAFKRELRRLVAEHAKLRVQIGMGGHVRNAHEICLVGSVGGATGADRGIPSVIVATRGEHSRKPHEIYTVAERLVGPNVPKLELFARNKRPGWDAWGDDPAVSRTEETSA